jgi:hypothetical protein
MLQKMTSTKACGLMHSKMLHKLPLLVQHILTGFGCVYEGVTLLDVAEDD